MISATAAFVKPPHHPGVLSGLTSRQPREVCERGLLVRTAGDEEPEAARGVADVRGGPVGRKPPGEPSVVRVGVGTEGAARVEELGAQVAMTLYVLGLEARALGGEAVGPAQDGELLPEGTGGAGEPGRRVVGAVVFHEA